MSTEALVIGNLGIWDCRFYCILGILDILDICSGGTVLHFFELRNFQHFVLYLFPALAFVFLFAASLAFMFFRKKDSEEREKRITETYLGEIEERNAPFPLIAFLTILGTVLWIFFYILFTGVLGVKI